MARPPAKKKAAANAGGKKKKGRMMAWLALTLLVAVTLGAGFYFIALYPGLTRHETFPTKDRASTAPGKIWPQTQLEKAASYEPAAKPRAAIVIDDMGYQAETGRALIALDLPLSFAFLPFVPHTAELQKAAQARGREILLHLPLEPTEPRHDSGPGTLVVAMPPAVMATAFAADLSQVPKALGVNNHMGSRFTADQGAMRTLMAMVRERDLFFLDSLTTPDSVVGKIAGEFGVRTARRAIFLDNEQEQGKVADQIELFLERARAQGQAVAIAHPYPATLEVLRRYQARLRTEVELVGVSRLVR